MSYPNFGRFASIVVVLALAALPIPLALGYGAEESGKQGTLGGRACAAATANPHAAHHGSGARATSMSAEHTALLNLAPDCAATYVATQSGQWSDPGVWEGGAAPGENARVYVPPEIQVAVDDRFGATFEWVRVDGQLSFAPDRNTSLKSRTILVSDTGKLIVGAPDAPIRAEAAARIIIAKRPGRDAAGDPFDLAGGVLVTGNLVMTGATKTPYVLAGQILRAGDRQVIFAAATQGWAIGDQILIPGVSPSSIQDELLTVAAIDNDGRRIELDRALQFDHPAPIGMTIPIANLTRNIVVESEAAGALAGRGHVMIMHQQTGTAIDGVTFKNLGRTDARTAQTTPELDEHGRLKPGTDDNVIGRYALHFHIRSGAKADIAPHVVRNSVIFGSPKFGLVNHGGNVLAENNVSYDVAGAHFVAENGSEIGAFRGNLAIRSAGSGEGIRSRDITYDFGHGGHGFWLQSGGVDLTGNYAFGQAQSGFALFGYPFLENGETIFFDGANIDKPAYADSLGRVLISNVNFYAAHNEAAGCAIGFEIWNHKLYANHAEKSYVEGFDGWNFANYGMFIPYTKNVLLRNIRLSNADRAPTGVGIAINTLTENIGFDNLDLSGFVTGVQLPQRGTTVLANSTLRNQTDIEIRAANLPDRKIEIENVVLDLSKAGDTTIAMGSFETPENADAAMVYETDEIVLRDRQGRRQRVLFPYQSPDYVPFTRAGPTALRGLSNSEIQTRYGLVIGGRLVSPGATTLANSNALVEALPAAPASEPPSHFEPYPLESQHFRMSGDGQLADAWQLIEADSRPTDKTRLVYLQKESPKFLLMKGLRSLEIHPDDVQYGYRVMGMIVSRVDGQFAMRAFSKEFYNLKVDADNRVRIAFEVSNMAGITKPIELSLLVTDTAVRRGQNLNFFVQKRYCGACGYDSLRAEAEQLLDSDRTTNF